MQTEEKKITTGQKMSLTIEAQQDTLLTSTTDGDKNVNENAPKRKNKLRTKNVLD